jgi:hypothetical protein
MMTIDFGSKQVMHPGAPIIIPSPSAKSSKTIFCCQSSAALGWRSYFRTSSRPRISTIKM